jgi:sortase A
MKSRTFIITGCVLLAIALAFTGYNIYEDLRAADDANKIISQLAFTDSSVNSTEELPAYILNPEMEMPVKTIEGNDYIGTLEIPAIGVTLPVICELTDSSLKIAPSRYAGSVYTDDLIIGAHNYRSHFRELRNLPVGSEVIFTDIEGNIFNFISTETETLAPTESEALKDGDWDITLFTCTFGGQYRIVIRCDKV